MIQYYIQTSTGQEGPYTLEELRQKNINPRTPVWNDVLHDWTPAGEIEALRPIIRVVPPPAFKPAMPSNKFREGYQKFNKRFGLNLFHWLGIVTLIILAVLYFYGPGRGGTSQPNESAGIDSSPVDSAQDLQRKRLSARLAAKNRNYRNNWSNYIKAVPGRYKTGFFGGISNLEAIVRNETEYPMDVVIVVVRYVKDNGEIYKSKYLPVYDVPAKGESTVRAPDSSRGKRVKVEIIQISSRRMNFLYSNDIEAKGKTDPYYYPN